MKRIVLTLIPLIVLLVGRTVYATPSLENPRISAMGGVATAVVNGSASAAYNPAGLSYVTGIEELSFSFAYNNAYLAYGLNHANIGVLYTLPRNDYQFNLAFVNDVFLFKTAHIENNAILSASLGYDELMFGASLGYIFEHSRAIQFNEETTLTQNSLYANVGLMLVLGQINLGASLNSLNIQLPGAPINEAYIPIVLRLGATYFLWDALIVSMDVQYRFLEEGQRDIELLAGAEYWLADTLAVRGGVQSVNLRNFGVSAGVVYTLFENIRIEYAAQYQFAFTGSFGNHTIGAHYQLPIQLFANNASVPFVGDATGIIETEEPADAPLDENISTEEMVDEPHEQTNTDDTTTN